MDSVFKGRYEFCIQGSLWILYSRVVMDSVFKGCYGFCIQGSLWIPYSNVVMDLRSKVVMGSVFEHYHGLYVQGPLLALQLTSTSVTNVNCGKQSHQRP